MSEDISGARPPIDVRLIVSFSVGHTEFAETGWRERLQEHVLTGIGEIASAAGARVTIEFGERTVDERLLMPIESWLTAENVPVDKKLISLTRNALTRDGLKTVRDVLALGEDGIEGVRNLSTKAKGAVRVALSNLGFTWEAAPAMSSIAKMYARLDEVPSFLVEYTSIQGIGTVQDILVTPIGELAKALALTEELEPRDHRNAARIMGKAKDFATRFYEAQRQALDSK